MTTGTFIISNNFHFLTGLQLLQPQKDIVVSGNLLVQWLPAISNLNLPIRYSLNYSKDAGQNWNSLSMDLTVTEFVWDTTQVDDGDQFRLQVAAD